MIDALGKEPANLADRKTLGNSTAAGLESPSSGRKKGTNGKAACSFGWNQAHRRRPDSVEYELRSEPGQAASPGLVGGARAGGRYCVNVLTESPTLNPVPDTTVPTAD